MRAYRSVIITLAVLLFAPVAARAVTIDFDFGYSDTNGTVIGTGVLSGSFVAPGEYLATSGNLVISGLGASTEGIAGNYALISNPNGPNPAFFGVLFEYDDLVYLGSNPPDNHGIVNSNGTLAFDGMSGHPETNLFLNNTFDNYALGYADLSGNVFYDFFTTPSTGTVMPGNPDGAFPYVSATIVPDGGMTVALLGLSLAGLAGAEALRRRLSA